jgi:streptogramin lyase
MMRFFPADLRPPQPLLARVLPLLVALPGLLPPAVAMAQTSFGTVNVGSTTAAQTLTFSFPSATVLNATTPVQVLTMGDPNLDFKNAGTGTCAAGAFTSCTVNVTFNPQASGMRQGAVVIEGAAGNVLATTYIYGVGSGPQVSFQPAAESLLSTSMVIDLTGGYPVADASGNLFFFGVWQGHGRGGALFEILAAGGYTTVNNYPALDEFCDQDLFGCTPFGIAIDGAGNIYVTLDSFNLGLSGANGAVIELVAAGGYTVTRQLGGGLNSPSGVAVDGSGNVYVADYTGSAFSNGGSGVVKEVPPDCTSASCVVTLASGFSGIGGIAADQGGNVFISDSGNDAVKEILAAGGYTTVKTLGSGFSFPNGVALDGNENVYVADQGNNAVKEILAAGGYTTVRTLTGSEFMFSGATLDIGVFDLSGITVDGSGNVYPAAYVSGDTPEGFLFRMDFSDPPSLAFGSVNSGDASAEQAVTVQNIGNAPLLFSPPGTGTNPSVPQYFFLDGSAPGACPSVPASASSPASLAAGASCNLSVAFEPTAAGTIGGNLTLTDNALNVAGTTQSVALSGTAIPGTATSTPAAQTINFPVPSLPIYGPDPIVLEATASSGLPVSYTVTSGNATLNGNLLSPAGVGPLTVQAAQAGNASYAPATPVSVSLYVEEPILGLITLSVIGTIQMDGGLSNPHGISVDANGDVFVADTGNNAVKEIPHACRAAGCIVTVANGFNGPYGVAVDKNGNLFVADTGNNAVKKIPAGCTASNCVTTVVVDFNAPEGIAVDAIDNIFVADTANNEIKEIPAGCTFSNCIKPLGAGFFQPNGVALDANDNVYVADTGNMDVKEILASDNYATTNVAVSTTVLTQGICCTSPDPTGVAVDASGGLYVADSGANHSILYIPAGCATTSCPSEVFGFGADRYFDVAVDPAIGLFLTGYQDGNVWEIASTVDLGSVPVGQMSFESYFGWLAWDYGTEETFEAVTEGFANPASCTVQGSELFVCGQVTDAGPVGVGQGDNLILFAPELAGLRHEAVVLQDGTGAALATEYFHGVGVGPQVGFLPGSQGAIGGGFSPGGVAVDGGGNAFVADAGNNAVKEIKPGCTAANCVTTLGSGFSSPAGVAMDWGGNVLVADTGNNAVKQITPVDGYSLVNTLGGGFSQPGGVAMDVNGNVFVADTGNNAVKEIPPGCVTPGCVTTLGSGFSQPSGVVLDGNGNLFVADTGNSEVKEILAAGGYTTIDTLGSGFSHPKGIALDPLGNLFVADTGNGAVKELLASGGYVTVNTVRNGFNEPTAVAVDQTGNVYAAVSGSVIKVDYADAPSLTFATPTVPGTTDTTDGTLTVTVENLGNAPLTFTSIALPGGNFHTQSVSNACSTSTALAVGASCSVGVVFSPTTSGPLTGTLTLTDNALNVTGATQSITVTGEALIKQTIDFTQITGIHVVGGTVNLSATATSGLPVRFITTTAAVCTVSGTTVSLIAAGSCDIEAQQWGNTTYAVAPFAFTIFWVDHKTQTISFPAIPHNQNAKSTLPLSATTSAGLTVIFESLTPATCTVTGATASLNDYGFCTIQASQPGNSTYGEAAHIVQTFFIHHRTQTIDFPPISAHTVGSPLTLSATASSELTVSFESLTPSVCTVSGTTATLSVKGTCTIEATQLGNGVYGIAPAEKQSFKVTAPPT